MGEIKCPNCLSVFQINDTYYNKIVKQIRDKEFIEELQAREKQFEETKNASIKLVKADLEKENATKLNEKEIEIIRNS